MKKRYILIVIGIIIAIIIVSFNDSYDEIKKDKKENNKIVEEKKEKYRYITTNYDNIEELLKENIIEDVVVKYVCEEVENKNGFITEEDNTYFYVDNERLTGKQEIDGDYYYFDEDGKLVTNSIIDNHYYNNEGKLTNGEFCIGNNCYYSTEEGIVKDTFMDNKYYDLNGVHIDNMKNEDNIYYYEDNEKVKGLKLINGIRYYFDFNDGRLIKKNVKSVIDISTWQDVIDFDKLKESDEIDGVIVRVGYGTTNSDCTLDNTFERNIKELKRLNIPYGLYIYGYAQNRLSALVEAEFVKNMIDKYGLELSFPIFYDAEITSFNGVYYSTDMYREVIDTFRMRLNEFGYENVGIYSNLHMLTRGSLNFEHNYPVWVAEYYDRCEYDKDYNAWQYTSKGNINGIEGNVDLNIFY